MRRSFVATFVALATVVALVGSTFAGRGWCRSDPIVRVGNTSLQIWVAIPLEDESSVTGPITVVITVPRGVAHGTLFTDAGFNGKGETVYWLENGSVPASGVVTVSVMVQVPIAGGRVVPMQVEVIPEVGPIVYVSASATSAILTVNLDGAAITDTSVVGASVSGASATAADGGDAVGESATGVSVVGASTVASPTAAVDSTVEPTVELDATPAQNESSLPAGTDGEQAPAESENQAGPDLAGETPAEESAPDATEAEPVATEVGDPIEENAGSEQTATDSAAEEAATAETIEPAAVEGDAAASEEAAIDSTEQPAAAIDEDAGDPVTGDASTETPAEIDEGPTGTPATEESIVADEASPEDQSGDDGPEDATDGAPVTDDSSGVEEGTVEEPTEEPVTEDASTSTESETVSDDQGSESAPIHEEPSGAASETPTPTPSPTPTEDATETPSPTASPEDDPTATPEGATG
jgi:hypothetical protein